MLTEGILGATVVGRVLGSPSPSSFRTCNSGDTWGQQSRCPGCIPLLIPLLPGVSWCHLHPSAHQCICPGP